MMARSQDELIDFLLAEIASSGAHGESSLAEMPHFLGGCLSGKVPSSSRSDQLPSISTLISYCYKVTA